jgi:hypothetical protein
MRTTWSGDYINRAERDGDPLIHAFEGRQSVFTPWDADAATVAYNPVSTRPPDYDAPVDTTSSYAAQAAQQIPVLGDVVAGPIDAVQSYAVGLVGKVGAAAIGIIAVGLGLYVLVTGGNE